MEQERPYLRPEGHTLDSTVTAADRLHATLLRLEAVVGAIQDSDSFRHYLDLQARFHQYSWGNVALILAQCPDATRVAGYRAWQALGRQVRRGERAIRIVVPLLARTAAADPDDAADVRLRFGVGSVFDISQTEGTPLPEVAVPVLEGDDGGPLYDDLARLAAREGLRIDRTDRLPSPTMMGSYDPVRRRITVREMAPLQMTKTLAHELGHHFTGQHETYDDQRDAHETIAEAVAYVVLAHFGLDSGARSFPYIATWARQPTVLRQALGTIQQVAATIISRVALPEETPPGALPGGDAADA